LATGCKQTSELTKFNICNTEILTATDACPIALADGRKESRLALIEGKITAAVI